MNVIIAIDSLKGSLSSQSAGDAAKEGVLRVFPDAGVKVFPVADGGEGTVDALVSATGGVMRRTVASDPLGRRINCEYGIIKGDTAVIEMACAAGLPLLSNEERDPLVTTTYGVGEIILDALGLGCRKFIIGIGGSATNDGGVGMLEALGFDILDQNGKPVAPGALGVRDVASVTRGSAPDLLWKSEFNIACDVKNPLCGKSGCSAVFAKQKGADDDAIAKMDVWLSRYAEITKKAFPDADPDAEGAGAAGGIGFAFMSFLGGRLKRGIDLVLNEINIEESIRNADIIITGEGRLDAQTVMGKTPIGVASIAKKYGKPVIGLSGCVNDGAKVCNEHGIDAFFPIVRSACTLEEAMNPEKAYKNMADTAEQVFRLIKNLK